ncbi:MAG: ABC transporter permease subunit, partial [Gemmataceae bacterium]
NFIWIEGYIVMIVLALAGALLVGNDFRHNSLPYYLAKPIGRWHYLLGKCLAISLFVHLMTTIPALILYLQAGLLYEWDVYYVDHFRQFVGIIAYGCLMGFVLSVLLVTTAVIVRRTVPLIMVWSGFFVLARALAKLLVDGANLPEQWRLVDLWNNLYLVGIWMLGAPRNTLRPGNQPEVWQAALVLALLVGVCTLILRKRVQAVEVIS